MLLYRPHFGQPALVPLLVRELGGDERPGQLLRHLRPDHPTAEDEHVHVIVLDALVRRVGVVTEAGANTRNFIRGNARAHTAPTHEHATLSLTVQDCLADLLRVIRVVDRRFVVRAEIVHVVASDPKGRGDIGFDLESRVIGGHGNAHLDRDALLAQPALHLVLNGGQAILRVRFEAQHERGLRVGCADEAPAAIIVDDPGAVDVDYRV